MIDSDSNRSNDASAAEPTLEQFRKRIETWVEESRSCMEKFKARPDHSSHAAQSELHESFRLSQLSKIAHEIALDRHEIALGRVEREQHREALDELRRVIRAHHNVFENWYWDFLWEHRGES